VEWNWFAGRWRCAQGVTCGARARARRRCAVGVAELCGTVLGSTRRRTGASTRKRAAEWRSRCNGRPCFTTSPSPSPTKPLARSRPTKPPSALCYNHGAFTAKACGPPLATAPTPLRPLGGLSHRAPALANRRRIHHHISYKPGRITTTGEKFPSTHQPRCFCTGHCLCTMLCGYLN
jgi:hypothetical protein